MTEALKIAPEPLFGINPTHHHPNHAEIPSYLIKVSDQLGMERGKFTEQRVQNLIISQTEIIQSVTRNEKNSSEDILGHDLTLVLNDTSSLKTVYIQVKSSRSGIIDYKQRIRDKFFPNNPDSPELVERWITDHGIILLNGSETKTDAEILESFYPQLERIQKLIIKKIQKNQNK